ncbi:MAG: hypothetical protein IJP16_09780 [Clostridia bacterium]|nr:hypothetical protein [Clostridia bacterium]
MKTKTTRALLMSVLSLLLCVSMLIGTTFAWFTDSVTSTGNIIKSGTLDVEMYWADGKEAPASATWKDASTGAIFDYDKWEPGYTEVRHIKIENKGTLALKYQISIIANGEVSKLSDVIDVYYSDPAVQVNDRTALANDMKLGTLTNVLDNIDTSASGTLTAGENHTITFALKMQESAGNEYQNKSIGTDFSVQLLATQLTYENDSFDDLYDKDSKFPNVSVPISIPEQDVQQPVTVEANGMTVVVPAEVINDLPNEITSLSLVYSDPIVVSNSVYFSSVDFVDQNGNTVNLENNTKAMTVTLPVQAAFAPGTVIDVFHDGVKVDSTSVAADGTITYSAMHFCAVSVSVPEDAYYVKNYDEFYAEVYYGGKVIPTNDITLTSFLVSPNATDIYLNGKNITGQTDFLFYAPVNSAKLSINGVGTVTTTNGYVSFATGGGEFTVNGGTFNMGDTTNNGHFFTQNSAKTIINGGTFISSDANTPILYCINGFIDINGGFFQNTANSKQALLSMGNNLSYINNQKITLRGGTFVNWNPMDSAFAQAWTNPDVPALIVLAEGYEVVSETQPNGDIWYTVVPSGN